MNFEKPSNPQEKGVEELKAQLEKVKAAMDKAQEDPSIGRYEMPDSPTFEPYRDPESGLTYDQLDQERTRLERQIAKAE